MLLQYANGIHAICELHLFLLREELSSTVNIYFSVITFSRTKTKATIVLDVFSVSNYNVMYEHPFYPRKAISIIMILNVIMYICTCIGTQTTQQDIEPTEQREPSSSLEWPSR